MKLLFDRKFAAALAVLIFSMAYGAVSAAPTDDPTLQFADPAPKYRPYAWWHWQGSLFSQEGITRDLEAMKDAGIGGAVIFNIGEETGNHPWPGQTYRSEAYWDAVSHTLDEAERLGMEIGIVGTPGYSSTGGPWIDLAKGMKKIVWSITDVDGENEIDVILPEIEGGENGRQIAVYAIPEKEIVAMDELIELTGNTDGSGRLRWRVPAGKWKICRLGYAPTGKAPHPIPEDLVGHTYEVDKMSRELNEYNWEKSLGPITERLGRHVGKTLVSISTDSYEAGMQNWTDDFREEFMRRKGYDPVPWLATLGQPLVHGWFIDSERENSAYQLIAPMTYARRLDNPWLRIIGSEEEVERFEWDMTDVISDLFFKNGWMTGKKTVNDAGMEFWMEGYRGPFDRNQAVFAADIPMVEFWTIKGNVNAPSVYETIPAAARAAGKTIVGAEALTGSPESTMWVEDPASLKKFADEAYGQGVNKFMLHEWAHQPFDPQYQPGMTMALWGSHFNPHQTWFEPGKAFFAYLGRVQYLLQQGEQVIDYLCLDKMEGLQSDVIAKDVFLESDIKVRDRNIVLPTGREYRFLVCPRTGIMLPEVAEKIERLVAAGATVVATRPVKSPSLKDYPKADEKLRKLADKVWGDSLSNHYKKGYVCTTIEEAKAHIGYTPDFIVERASVDSSQVMVLHRHTLSSEIYYISNQSSRHQDLSVSFRITGMQPELWQAENGCVAAAPVWEQENGKTRVDLGLKGIQTVFVVFRKEAAGGTHITSVSAADSSTTVTVNDLGKPVLRTSSPLNVVVTYSDGSRRKVETAVANSAEPGGDWAITFVPKLGEPFGRNAARLKDFGLWDDPQVKYFSGTAIFARVVNIDAFTRKRVLLKLGELHDIARLRVNGKEAGTLWYPPYSADITDYVTAGENLIEVEVTNNWRNQLIGDEQHPRDFEMGDPVDFGQGPLGAPLKEFPDWFLEKKERPVKERKTFTTWHYFDKDSKLVPAGLIGPVSIEYQTEVEL